MLSRLIMATITICAFALPAAAQSKPDCSKVETKEGAWVQRSSRAIGGGKCEIVYDCAPKSADSGRKKATLGDFLGCAIVDTAPLRPVPGNCDPLTGPCTTCKVSALPSAKCTVNLVKR
jgi:hypothetical protein